MKKAILTSIFVLGTFYQTFAQQHGKIKHMTISIMETSAGHSPNMFISRDDTAQVQKYVEFNLHVKLRNAQAAHENQIMQLLKPYYNNGWKLVTVSSAKYLEVNISRFFFIKDE